MSKEDNTDIAPVIQNIGNVNGDVAGGNIEKPVTNYYLSYVQKTAMSKLIAKFKEETENDIFFNKTIELLEHYHKRIDSEIEGLEKKLTDAKRENEIADALFHKESFNKKLMQFAHYESAQRIFTYLLAELHVSFNNKIKPMIISGRSQEDINRVLHNEVINPLFIRLEENIMDINHAEISGMIYFLTGNCYIRWN